MINISVIIPVYNAEKTIKKCVESVLANNYSNFEVIVVDDKSTDSTRGIVESIKDKRLKFFVNDNNKGAPFTRNHGIHKASGDLILLLDADSYVGYDWIRKHADSHGYISADIIGGSIAGVYSTIYGRCDNFCSWWTSIPYSKSCYIKRCHLPTNNMSIKSSVFKKIGYFNEDLKTGEDVEFCFKALKSSQRIYFKSDIVTYHYDRDNLQDFLKHQQSWGDHTMLLRKKMRMDFSFLFPNSLFMAYFYILPLSVFYTVFTITKWIKYQPSVLLCTPLIFLAKLKQTSRIKNYFIKIHH